jgi:hypothetical protein
LYTIADRDSRTAYKANPIMAIAPPVSITAIVLREAAAIVVIEAEISAPLIMAIIPMIVTVIVMTLVIMSLVIAVIVMAVVVPVLGVGTGSHGECEYGNQCCTRKSVKKANRFHSSSSAFWRPVGLDAVGTVGALVARSAEVIVLD